MQILRTVSPTALRNMALSKAPHYLPLFDAVDAGVRLIAMSPEARWPVPGETCGCGPWVVVLGDDHPAGGRSNDGPAGFDKGSVEWVLGNASHVVVYSGTAEMRHYAAFALTAVCGGRVAVVETTVRNHAAWVALVKGSASRAAFLEISPLSCAPAGRA